jgi:cytochrome c oxidase subunit IV
MGRSKASTDKASIASRMAAFAMRQPAIIEFWGSISVEAGGNMKLIWLLAVLLFSVRLNAQSSTNRWDLNTMLTALKAGGIKRVEILRIPENITTDVANTQETLRRSPSYYIVLNYGFDSALESLLAEISTKKSDKHSDLSWGVLLFDESGHEAGSIFVDYFGMKGYLNGEPVQFSENMSKRMRKFVQELR